MIDIDKLESLLASASPLESAVAMRNAAPALFAEMRRLRAIEAAARNIYDEHAERDYWWVKVQIQRKHWDDLKAALAAKEEA